MAVPPGKVDRSSKYNKNIAMVELKRHVSNLIVIHPNEEAVNDEDTGMAGSVQLAAKLQLIILVIMAQHSRKLKWLVSY